jgi:hypothetical protein
MAVGGGNPRRFLTTVLKRIKSVVTAFNSVGRAHDAEYTAFFFFFRVRSRNTLGRPQLLKRNRFAICPRRVSHLSGHDVKPPQAPRNATNGFTL